MAEALVRAEGLERTYTTGETQVAALAGLSLDVQRGEFVAVMGPSGSGKSTLMHLLAGLDKPTSGSVVIDGQELSGLDDRPATAATQVEPGDSPALPQPLAKELKNVKTADNKTTAEVTGTLTIKGTSKEVTAPVTLTYLKDKLGQRVPNMKGDLLVIRANFSIKRSDFGINPKAPEEKVTDEIALSLSIAGASAR